MSNLIKSGFIAFSQDDALVIDANQNKIIQAIDASVVPEETNTDSVEEALAEALIRDAELEGADFGDDILTFDTAELPDIDGASSDFKQVADEVIVSAKQEAEDIVNRAHDEAEQLRAKAYEEAESIKTTAHDEGYETGYQEAMNQANEEIRMQYEELELKRQELETQFNQYKETLILDTEKKMVDLLCKYVTNVTGVVIDSQQDVLLYMINNSMKDLDNSKHFVIKVSSEDYPLVESKKADIYGAMNPNIEIELFEDVKLSSKQCMIETDNGIVDLSLDVQLDNLMIALKLMIKD